MLNSGMTSVDDFSNLLSLYYFFYVSQTAIVLDQFCQGKRDETISLYYALDWEKVRKNRRCCSEGWEKLQVNINHMFSHAITLEIINQHADPDVMFDYIALQEYINLHPEEDDYTGNEETEFPDLIILDDFEAAIHQAYALASPGDLVALSPACSSFDRFKNFAERGNTFRAIVESMEES